MPKLPEDFLRHAFEGSSFVWKDFKRNPALSILGMPLVLMDAALLPLRAVTSRESTDSDNDRELERLRREQGMPGTENYARYIGKAPRNADHVGTNSTTPENAAPFSAPRSRDANSHHEHHHRHRKHRRRKPESNETKSESVMVSGWRLPHNRSAARPERRRKHERSQRSTYGNGDDGDIDNFNTVPNVHARTTYDSQGQGRPSARTTATVNRSADPNFPREARQAEGVRSQAPLAPHVPPEYVRPTAMQSQPAQSEYHDPAHGSHDYAQPPLAGPQHHLPGAQDQASASMPQPAPADHRPMHQHIGPSRAPTQARTPAMTAVQMQGPPTLNGPRSGVSQRDFATAQPHTRMPQATRSRGGPVPHNSTANAAGGLRFQEPSRSSRYSSRVSDAQSHNDEDGESYVSQTTRRTFKSRTSDGSEQTWPGSPSTIRTLPQFKPTGRAESVAPDESPSVVAYRAANQRERGSLHPSRASATPSRRSNYIDNHRPDPQSQSRFTYDEGSTTSSSRTAAWAAQQKPSRAPTISTIDTADLPDTVDGQPNPTYHSSRATSRHTTVPLRGAPPSRFTPRVPVGANAGYANVPQPESHQREDVAESSSEESSSDEETSSEEESSSAEESESDDDETSVQSAYAQPGMPSTNAYGQPQPMPQPMPQQYPFVQHGMPGQPAQSGVQQQHNPQPQQYMPGPQTMQQPAPGQPQQQQYPPQPQYGQQQPFMPAPMPSSQPTSTYANAAFGQPQPMPQGGYPGQQNTPQS